jgi:LuxR family maltose regulon positive regulatory protein
MPAGARSAQVQRGLLDSPFLRSKFRVPTAPQHFVHRARLAELLDDLAAYPVTAVVAPAGAGKTALAADWLRCGGWPSAWLAVDESDRAPAQLCAAIIAAVEPLAPGVADRTLKIVGGPGGPGGPVDAIRALSDDLELAAGGSAVLVLDDLHRIDDSEPARAVLVDFVEHKPDWLHLLLLSRRRPALPVDRLRASGWLVDLGFDVLKFSRQEGLEMLAGLCPDSAPQELASAAEWSDGWAAALRLAALAVRSRRSAHLTEDRAELAAPAGSDRLVDSYLWHEVLRAEPPELVDLLLSTAVVERVNYGLAEALSGRSDAGDLLQEAEERGLFVTGFDSGGWFEVHSLVREVLLAELARRSPERTREQHARAARWLESMADHLAAIEHWLDAGEPGEALRLLAAVSMSRLDAGSDPESILRILERIPPEASGADAASLVRYAECLLGIDRAGFLDAVAAAEGALTEGATPEEAGRLGILRSAAAWLAGEWRACIDQATAGLERLGDAAMVDPIGRFGWTLLSQGLALEERWSDSDRVVGVVRAAVVNDTGRRLAHEGARTVGLALAGLPLDSLRIAAGVRRGAESADMRMLCTELDIAEAIAARELGDRDSAEPALQGLASRSAYPCTFVQVLAALELVEMRLGVGDVPAARSLFHQAVELAGRDLDGPQARGRLARTGVLVSLAEGDLAAAEHWSGQVDDAFWGPICEARCDLAAGRQPDAVEAVRRSEPRCERHLVVRELVLARAITDVDRSTALKCVEAAVERAAEHGMLQTVAADGGAVLDLVELAAWRAPTAWMDRLRCALLPDLTWVSAVPGVVEELTSREREVMRLLPTRLTLREIASELFVSQNTLKFHLRVIYRKLGVNSRAEAGATARRLRLLARA